jgi:tyrosinase
MIADPSPPPSPQQDYDYWGGFCPHRSILFPTWHRAYVYRLEEALRKHGPDANLALPFWDECYGVDNTNPQQPKAPDNPVPWVLTSPKFPPESEYDNPLYSYKLQQALADIEDDPDPNRYKKGLGYETVRYPLSGLVGNPLDQEATVIHNTSYPSPLKNADILNQNVKAWLEGNIKIDESGGQTNIPDTKSTYNRYVNCLRAPNYTAFSNNASAAEWSAKHLGAWNTALESPHNAIHLSLGGFFEPAVYNADPIRDANGDIGENETAGFDPIFYFHHCFVDYVFWQWQIRNNKTATGSLDVITGYDGTVSTGSRVFPYGKDLTLESDLAPFLKSPNVFYNSNGVTDIQELGYIYGSGSLDSKSRPDLGAPETPRFTNHVNVSGINRADIPGSFVIRTTAKLANDTVIEIGREPILSRWNVKKCANCQNHLEEQAWVPLDEKLVEFLKDGRNSLKDVPIVAHIETHHGLDVTLDPHNDKLGATKPLPKPTIKLM